MKDCRFLQVISHSPVVPAVDKNRKSDIFGGLARRKCPAFEVAV